MDGRRQSASGGQEHLPVIIVSYNTRELLRRCLSALLASEGVAPQPIVVDNASSDGSAAMVRDEFPCVRVIALDSNRGFAAANNVALRELGFRGQPSPRPTPLQGEGRGEGGLPEYILLLNPDTEVQPDAVVTLLRFIRAHPRAGVVGAQLTFADGRFQHSAFRFPGLAQTIFDFFPLHGRLINSRLNGRYPQRNTPFEIDHPLGACMLARRDVIEQVGLMDEAYFMYVEEVDWCRRIKRASWQIWCEPRARIVHHEGQATRQFRHAMFVAKWRSRVRYFHKFHSPQYVALVRAIIRLGLWSEARKLSRESLAPDERTRLLDAFTKVRALL